MKATAIALLVWSSVFCGNASAQPNWTQLGYDIRPLPGLRYDVSQNLLVDYAQLLLYTVPALDSLIAVQDRVIRQDSILIAQQRLEIEAYERQEVDLGRVVTLYESEIEKRREIEVSYQHELRKVKWWRRGAVAAGIGAVTILILK